MTRVDFSEIEGVSLFESKFSFDSRGTNTKFYDGELQRFGPHKLHFNTLMSASNIQRGTVRGLHFQKCPVEEEKLIFCLSGEVFDVIVDLREGSITRGKWTSLKLTEAEPRSLFLPKGVAHGYQTLKDNTVMFYAMNSEFNQKHAHTLNYADEILSIDWPLHIASISSRDLAGISLTEALLINSLGSPQ